MVQSIIPLTELEAVNLILSSIGESPVSTLAETEVIDASLALQLLKMTSFEVQSKGWQFNTETNFKINPDVNGHIILPSNTLRADTYGDSRRLDLSMRGNRMYNRETHSFFIGQSVYLELQLQLGFEELPSSAKWYIALKSARRFQDRYLGDPSIHQFHLSDEQDALTSMMEEDVLNGDPNLIESSPSYGNLFRHRIGYIR